MIRFNPYDVRTILFLDKKKYQEIKGTPANQRAVAIAADPVNYYLFTGAFTKPEIDAEKIHDTGNLKEGIYIQEVRTSLKITDWLRQNVFKSTNNHILDTEYLYKYRYVDIFNAERRKLEKKTGLSNKMVIMLDKDNNSLFVGLIDVTENTIAREEESFTLKLYSLTYLIKKVQDIEVCLYSKANATEYNRDTLFGLPGTNQQNPEISTQITGYSLRKPENVINLMLFEAMRYYFGDETTLPVNGAPPRYMTFVSESEVGTLSLKKDFCSGSTNYNGLTYDLDISLSFLRGNYIYICYKNFNTVQIGEAYENVFNYRYYKHSISDDMEVLTTSPEFTKMFTVWMKDNNFPTVFKNNMGFDLPPAAERWQKWVDNPYYIKLELIAQSNGYKELAYNYKLPILLDYDICESGENGATGKMLKLGEMAELALAYCKWYIDTPFNGETYIGRTKALTNSYSQLWEYDDNIQILTDKQLALGSVDFDCFDMLNLENESSAILKKIYTHKYNNKLYGASLEEVTAVTPRLISPDQHIKFGNLGRFITTQTEPVYDQNGFKYTKATMWRLSYE